MELSDFSKALKNAPALSQEELIDLAKRIQNGDSIARSKMIESNMRLVVKVASRNYHKARHLGADDIIQQGFIGLIQAVDRYDPYKLNPKNQKPYRFSTYAVWWIEHHIQQALQFQEDEIHVPFERLKESGFENPVSHSLDDPQIDEKTLMEIIGDPEQLMREDALEAHSLTKTLIASADLTGLEREIIKLSGGLVDGIERSDREISAMLGHELKAVKKIKKEAREKLQAHMSESH